MITSDRGASGDSHPKFLLLFVKLMVMTALAVQKTILDGGFAHDDIIYVFLLSLNYGTCYVTVYCIKRPLKLNCLSNTLKMFGKMRKRRPSEEPTLNRPSPGQFT